MKTQTFTLSEEEQKKADEWMESRQPNAYAGAIGGRWTYSFTPTSIGVVVTLKDAMGDKAEIDLTDYDLW